LPGALLKSPQEFALSVESPLSLSEEFELLRVRFYEISAKVLEGEREQAEKQASEQVKRDSRKGSFNVEVGVKNDDNQLGIRVAVDYTSSSLVARVDCAAFFKKVSSAAKSLPEDALRSVAEEAVLVLIPYIREAMAETTRRVAGKPVMLGTVRVNDLASTEDS